MRDTIHYGLETLTNVANSGRQVFVLCDSNTHEDCLPRLTSLLPQAEIIEIPAGEKHKNLETCSRVWNSMLDCEATRDALLINLGGGVLCDLGGFCASAYKRGIDHINIPTTLLAMIDAALGGKTGVNFSGIKNSVGHFKDPLAIYIEPDFLETLNERQLRNGFAEMLKHGLVANAAYWTELSVLSDITPQNLLPSIRVSIEIKEQIVQQDPLESGKRKLLNFGHTIGHALEGAALSHPADSLLHGEAVAWGMVAEAWISTELCGLPQDEFNSIKEVITKLYKKPLITNPEALITLMRNDKKRDGIAFNMTGLLETGKGIENISAPEAVIMESLKQLN